MQEQQVKKKKTRTLSPVLYTVKFYTQNLLVWFNKQASFYPLNTMKKKHTHTLENFPTVFEWCHTHSLHFYSVIVIESFEGFFGAREEEKKTLLIWTEKSHQILIHTYSKQLPRKLRDFSICILFSLTRLFNFFWNILPDLPSTPLTPTKPRQTHTYKTHHHTLICYTTIPTRLCCFFFYFAPAPT